MGMESLKCPLCLGKSTWTLHQKVTGESYHKCLDCNLIFLNPQFHLKPDEELRRYQSHENDPEQKGYQDFLAPVIAAVRNSQLMKAEGLDFGCGPNSVVIHTLKKEGYNIKGYDPYFHDDSKLLQKKYDYIVCTEVIEHFYKPFEEFARLRSLLKPLGSLYLKTSLTDSVEDFEKWHYHRDPSHVCFYSEKSIRWICRNLRWNEVEIGQDRIVIARTT